tara:strand:+ start:138 stop:662 length:525 start_codon:yes stop_codon:yes gene_type:complete
LNIKKLLHLGKRFFTSLFPRSLREDEIRWVQEQLNSEEFKLWLSFSKADKRHSFEVAHRVTLKLKDQETPYVAAALLHDIGKLSSCLGIFGRTIATLISPFLTRNKITIWTLKTKGFRCQLANYLEHPKNGEKILKSIHSAPLTIAWVSEHHSADEKWSVPHEIGLLLSEADND